MQAQQGTFPPLALAIDRLFSLGVQSRSKGAKGHTLGNIRRVEISEDGKVDSKSCNEESSSKVNINNHRMPWPVASPETISSLCQPTHW